MKLSLNRVLSTLTLAGSLGTAFLLEGCNGSGISSSERIISDGWAGVAKEDSEDQAPLYCYKTIGTTDCYATPDPKRSAQLMTVYPAKNTARPIGVEKIVKALMEPHDPNADAIKERELDKVRYYPSPHETFSQNTETPKATKSKKGPINIK